MCGSLANGGCGVVGDNFVLLDYFPAAIESLRNCLRSFSISSDALRARAPAALFPFST